MEYWIVYGFFLGKAGYIVVIYSRRNCDLEQCSSFTFDIKRLFLSKVHLASYARLISTPITKNTSNIQTTSIPPLTPSLHHPYVNLSSIQAATIPLHHHTPNRNSRILTQPQMPQFLPSKLPNHPPSTATSPIPPCKTPRYPPLPTSPPKYVGRRFSGYLLIGSRTSPSPSY